MEINSGDTAWVLTSAALVMIMTPGVAFFYGGMVRAKSVLNMMMMCFGAMATIGVMWVLYGYSTAFGNSVGGLVGNQVGGGNGRKLATVAGAVAGGFAGRRIDQRHVGGQVVASTRTFPASTPARKLI